MRQVVATIDGRPRQAGDRYTLSNQTARPAAASEMGQDRTGALQHAGAEDVTSHTRTCTSRLCRIQEL
jgi:hypothetical protein